MLLYVISQIIIYICIQPHLYTLKISDLYISLLKPPVIESIVIDRGIPWLIPSNVRRKITGKDDGTGIYDRNRSVEYEVSVICHLTYEILPSSVLVV